MGHRLREWAIYGALLASGASCIISGITYYQTRQSLVQRNNQNSNNPIAANNEVPYKLNELEDRIVIVESKFKELERRNAAIAARDKEIADRLEREWNETEQKR